MNTDQVNSPPLPVLASKKLSLTRAGRVVLREISLELAAGELVAMIGPNGAGKSTLLAALAGLRALDGGSQDDTLCIMGKSLRLSSKGQLAKQIAFLPAHTSVPFPLTVAELIDQAEPTASARANAIAVLELAALEHVPVTRLSTGEAKRAWLAMVLSRQTPILLLDEPLAGLDPRYQVRLLEHLQARATAGALVVFIAHDLPYASRVDRVLALGPDGRLHADGPPASVLTAEKLRALYGVEVWLAEEPESGLLYPVVTRAV
jgi:iron complex transport system ATP-binding protein